MEAYSIEDTGKGICFNVFCYNAQPQVEINYANGDSKLVASAVETQPPSTQAPATQPPATQPPATQPPATQPPATQPPTPETPVGTLYIINTKTHKYHKPSCSRLPTTNRQDVYSSSAELEANGYDSCGWCH
jgi:DNA-entry nuclease